MQAERQGKKHAEEQPSLRGYVGAEEYALLVGDAGVGGVIDKLRGRIWSDRRADKPIERALDL